MASGDAASNGCLVGETFVILSLGLSRQLGVIDMDTENNGNKVFPHVHSELVKVGTCQVVLGVLWEGA